MAAERAIAAEETPAPEEPDAESGMRTESFITPFMADVIGVGASLVAGAATAWSFIESSAYKNLSSLGLFDHMKPERKRVFKETIQDPLEHGTITAGDAFQKVDALIEVNEREAAALQREFGVESFMEKWALLRGHQKIETAMIGLGVAGVALGSVLQLTRAMFTKEEEKTMAEGGDKAQPGTNPKI